MATGTIRSEDSSNFGSQNAVDPIKTLYSMVNEEETPLPRCWSSKDKYSFIGLSQNNLRVHYKGHGKSHKDAASVRATHPIPAACGLYYYEVKIVSKGRDGTNHLSSAGVASNLSWGSGTSCQGGLLIVPASTCSKLSWTNTSQLTTSSKMMHISHPNGLVSVGSASYGSYMGIGLSAQGVNMNRLPGWDKNSYGYHGDDGHSFCSSGTGQPYGPTFTTGDVIGCGINLIDNVCFYTKNGNYLGVAFTDLPPNLYPTVGLQTPGEIVDANFGQSPFVFDIEEMMKELRSREHATIQNFPVSDTYSQWQTMLHKMVSTYLVHHGYCATAEAFARSTSQDLEEELTSIRNRQKIQKLVLSGRLGEAIKTVKELYPGLLEKNLNLLFMLRVRQFIEMVNGTDAEVQLYTGSPSPPQSLSHSSDPPCPPHHRSHSPSPDLTPTSMCWTNGKLPDSYVSKTPAQHTSVIQSTKNIMSSFNHGISGGSNPSTEELNQRNAHESNNASVIHSSNSTANGTTPIINPSPPVINPPPPIAILTPAMITPTSSNSVSTSSATSSTSQINDSDVEMDFVEAGSSNNSLNESVNRLSEASNQSNGFTNGYAKHDEDLDPVEDMDVEGSSRKMCRGNSAAVEKMLLLGRELQQMSQNLRRELGKNKQNKTMLQDAFSLLAYNDPWSSPVGWQLDPIQREPVCQSLNSAILESHQLPSRPPLEICISHTKQLINLMSKSGLGSCAFASVESILNSQKGLKNRPIPPLSSSSSEQPLHHLNSHISQPF